MFFFYWRSRKRLEKLAADMAEIKTGLCEYRISQMVINRLARDLRMSNDTLSVAVAGANLTYKHRQGYSMNPLQPLIDEIARAKGINASAVALIQGFPAKVQAAVDAALAGGATGQQVADAVGAVLADFKTSEDALAAAVAANP